MQKLHYPICCQEESIAIAELVATCPLEFRQKALDEIEGARQAGVIKTNLVPFARGIVTAIHRGTFTVGHGAKVVTQRKQRIIRTAASKRQELPFDAVSMNKGLELMARVKQHNI